MNLTLNIKTPSILDKIELNESIDLNILNRLINSNLLQLTRRDKFGIEFDNEKQQLLEISKRVKNNKLKVQYFKAKYNYGRVFPSKALSLGSLRRPIRHTLCHNNYTDIDIENCHPQLLKQICDKNNIAIKYLSEYVNNRPAILLETQNYYNVSRDNAKLLYLILAYYGSFDNWLKEVGAENKPPTEFINNYIKELNIIGVHISNANSNLKKIVQDLEKRNEKGTVVSLYLQDVECKILEVVYKFLIDKKYIHNNNCILCYDGLMIESKYYKPELLNELHDHILNVAGFDLLFTTKSLDKHLLNELPEMQIDETCYESVKLEFEKKVCKISEGVIYAILKDDLTYSYISHDQCNKRFCQLKYTEHGKKECFINRWLKDENMKVYEDMDIYPNESKCPKNIFNLWIPFECERYTNQYEKNQEGLDMYLHLIKVLCNNEQHIFDFVCKWIGQMIVYPEIKTYILTFISNQGAGKNTLIRGLIKMLGSKKVLETTNPKRDIWGDFNGPLMDSFLVNLNELSKKETLEAEGKIKGLITDSTITVNRKGVNQTTIKSYHRFIITTNKDDPISTSNDDRRNLIIRSSDDLINNKDFFDKLYKLLDDDNVIRTIYDHFKNLPDLDKFHKMPIPKTSYQTELKKLSLTPPEQFLIDLCEINESKKELIILDKDFFQMFQDFIVANNIDYDTTPLKLGVRISNLKTNAITPGTKTTQGKTKIFNLNNLRKHFNIHDDIFIDEKTKPINTNTNKPIKTLNINQSSKTKTTKNKLYQSMFELFDEE